MDTKHTNSNSPFSNIKKLFCTKKRVFLAIGVSLVILIAIGSTLFYFTRSPKAAVMSAVSRTFSNTDKSTSSYFHTKELGDLLASGKYQTSASIRLEDFDSAAIKESPYKDFITLAPGIDLTTQVNVPDKKTSGTVSLLCGGSSILNVNTYALDNTVGIECPDLFDGFLSFDTTTFAQDYNQSYLCTLFGSQMLDDTVNTELFTNTYVNQSLFAQYKAAYPEDTTALYEALSVKKEKKDTLTLADDTTIPVTGYNISIPRAHMEKLLDNLLHLAAQQSESTYQEYKYQLEQQFGLLTLPEIWSCTVYINPKTNTMVKCEEQNLYLSNKQKYTSASTLSWTGNTYPANDFLAHIAVTNEENTSSIDFNAHRATDTPHYRASYALTCQSKQGDTIKNTLAATLNASLNLEDGSLTMDADAINNSTDLFSLTVNGSFHDINTESTKLAFSLDDCTLQYPDANADTITTQVSAELSLSSLQADVSTPASEPRPVLYLKEDDFYGLVYEAIRNFSSSPLGSFVQSLE